MSSKYKEQILQAMKDYFGADQKRISHALKVLKYAEENIEKDHGDPDIVVAVAILHDIGIHEAERKYNSTAAKYQEIEGPPIAKDILEKLKFPTDKLSKVLQIIAHHHHPGIVVSRNFNILYDADCRVNREG